MTHPESKITIRQLRSLLFLLDNQEMSVRELRQRLFDVEDQDEPIEPQFGIFTKLGVEP